MRCCQLSGRIHFFGAALALALSLGLSAASAFAEAERGQARAAGQARTSDPGAVDPAPGVPLEAVVDPAPAALDPFAIDPGPAAVDPDAALFGTCIKGDNDEIVYAPPGQSCGAPEPMTFRPIDEFLPVVAEDTGPWVTVQIGEERLYQLSEVTELLDAPASSKAKQRAGLRYDQVVAAESGTAEIRSVLRYPAEEDGGSEIITRAKRTVRPTSEAFQLLSKRFDWLGKAREVRMNPVPHFLPSAKQGATWDAGSYDIEGILFSEQGTVLGLQEARTPAGDFPGSLVVRHLGTVEGQTILAPGKYLTIENGRVERRTWIARGVGPVLMRESFEFTLEDPTGRRQRQRITTRLALRGVAEELATVPAAADGSAPEPVSGPLDASSRGSKMEPSATP